MLKPKKRLSHKEMKQDPLMTSIGQARVFYDQNKKYISYATTGLIILVIAIVIYINNRRANSEKAATELGKIYKVYDNGAIDKTQYKVAIDGQPDRGIIGLKNIVDNYGSSQAGELSRFYLANAYYNLGQYDDALKQYGNFSSSDPLLSASAVAGLGACYEVKKDFARAASNYEKAVSLAGASDIAAEYLNNAARSYGLAGDKEKAVSLFKKLKKEFPTSTYARDADRYITQFSL
jgi:tetratricopeptide (TPR) repeat protein